MLKCICVYTIPMNLIAHTHRIDTSMPLSIPFSFWHREKKLLHNCKQNQIGLKWITVIYHHRHRRIGAVFGTMLE